MSLAIKGKSVNKGMNSQVQYFLHSHAVPAGSSSGENGGFSNPSLQIPGFIEKKHKVLRFIHQKCVESVGHTLSLCKDEALTSTRT